MHFCKRVSFLLLYYGFVHSRYTRGETPNCEHTLACTLRSGGHRGAPILELLEPSGCGQHVHSVRAPVRRIELGVVNEEARREALRPGDAHELQ